MAEHDRAPAVHPSGGIDPARAVVGFARLLRAAGLSVSTDSVLLFARALTAVGWARGDRVYWAARASLCRRVEDEVRFDECFRGWFADLPAGIAPSEVPVEAVLARDGLEDDRGEDGAVRDDPADVPVLTLRFSRAEVLAHRDFASYTEAEHEEARRALTRLRVVGATRRSRRLVRTRRAAGRPDVRRTVRAALRTDGEPLRRYARHPSLRPRRLVVLCDVSGSMEPYARVIIRFLQAAVVARTRVEAFALGTRVTRVTRELSTRDPDAAVAAAAARVVDWSGGTRLGETLRTFNTEWGVRGIARGAVVVIVSDGWDRGAPELLGAEMARLGRVAHRIVWVNPLKASPGYAPLAAGMAAALPHVDEFVEGHSLASLEALVEVIERTTTDRRVTTRTGVGA